MIRKAFYKRFPARFLLLLTAAAFPVSAENLIPGDTSFETEPATLTSGQWDIGIMPVIWDSANAFHGKRSLRVDWDQKNRRMHIGKAANGWTDSRFSLDTADLKDNQKYTLSFYTKSDKDRAPFDLILLPSCGWEFAGKKAYVVKTFYAGNEWKRHTLTFTPHFKGKPMNYGYSLHLSFKRTPVGKYWFDAFQVEQGDKATDYVPSAPMSLGVHFVPFGPESGSRDTVRFIYYPGDKISGTVRVRSNDGKGGTLSVKTINYRGKTVAAWKREVKGGEDIPLAVDSKLRGWFKTTAVITRGGKEIVSHSANYIVIDKPEPKIKGIEPFFGCITKIAYMDVMKRIGVKRIEIEKSWKTTYIPGIEKEPGKYDLRSMEMQIKYARENDMEVKVFFSPFFAPKWHFDEKTWKEANCGHMGQDSLVSEQSLNAWEKIILLLVDRCGKDINTLELGGEDNGVLGSSAYYRTKHPEYLVDGIVAKGPVFNRIYDKVQEVVRKVKKRCPGIKTAIVRPSQGREGDRWVYLEKVMERIGKCYDVTSIDTYVTVPYTYSPLIKNHTGTVEGREYTRDLIWNFINKYGNNQPVFISESGIQGDYLYPDYSVYEVERARTMAKDFLMCRAMDFYAYDTFSGIDGTSIGRFKFEMTMRHKLQIIMPMLATSARIVENVTQAKYVKLPGVARLTIFKKHDGSGRAGIWADKGYCFKPPKKNNLTVMDAMGNRILPDKEGKYMLGVEHILVSAPDYDKMTAELKQSEFSQTDFCMIRCEVQKENVLTVRLDNTSSKRDARILLSVKSDAGNKEQELSVPADGFRYAYMPVSGSNAEITVQNVTTKSIVRKNITLPKLNVIIRKPSVFAKVSERFHILPNEPWTPWSGPDDLSAEFFGHWDAKYLYLEVRVKDDKHFNKFNATWEADSLQIAIDPKGNAGIQLRSPGVFGKDDIEFGIALSSKTGKTFTTVSAGPRTLLDAKDYTIVRDEKSKTTGYRVRIPWSAMKVVPEKGRVFGMSLVLFDDDTNGGMEYFAPVGGGICGKKDPSQFLKFVLQ